ncbi:hypothetical protein M427DRAFT_45931 [Gonapodya prolifera JEL478]|uniref:SLC41A/MgtE integral membrane domain-containing protein n=1 Tax=Gonapodya prolifera (strain JEL478) TaxID=1344416 RepID=A0A139A8Z7_GONPJ|nr:hypothetical protein M427DRAFT_45931 [Gonapodya prolifera JEL478]|eukprot:KXS13207.1 hypothetical protein M427DRAFT_45931 [Gonapodya prolifera JEL478]
MADARDSAAASSTLVFPQTADAATPARTAGQRNPPKNPSQRSITAYSSSVNPDLIPDTPPSPRSAQSVRSIVMSTISDVERGFRQGPRTRAAKAALLSAAVESEMVTVGQVQRINAADAAFLRISERNINVSSAASSTSSSRGWDDSETKTGRLLPSDSAELVAESSAQSVYDERSPLLGGAPVSMSPGQISPNDREPTVPRLIVPQPPRVTTRPPPEVSERDFLLDLLHNIETKKLSRGASAGAGAHHGSGEPMDDDSDPELQELAVSRTRALSRKLTSDGLMQPESLLGADMAESQPVKVTRRKPKRRRTETGDGGDGRPSLVDSIRARLHHLEHRRSVQVAENLIPPPRNRVCTPPHTSTWDADTASPSSPHSPLPTSTWSRWWTRIVLPRLPAIIMAKGVRSSWLVAAFVPVVVSACGNTGVQSSELALRTLSTMPFPSRFRPSAGAGGPSSSSPTLEPLRHMSPTQKRDHRLTLASRTFRLFVGELLASIFAGAICGSVLGLVAFYTSGRDTTFAVVVGVSVLIGCTLSGMLGVLGPLMFRYVGVDPVVASGPIETSVQNIGAVAVFLGLVATYCNEK